MKTTSLSMILLFTLSLLFFLPHTTSADTVKLPLPEGAIARFGRGIIYSITYSLNGNLVAAGSSVGIYLYDAHTNQELAFFPNHSSVLSISFSPDGKILASAGGGLRLWDIDTGKEKAILTELFTQAVSFSPDGKTLASGGKGLCLWDVATGKEKATLINTGNVYNVSFNPNGKTLASGGPNGLHLWDVATGTEIATLTTNDGWGDVSFSPDGKTLVSTGGFFGDDVRLWDVDTLTEKAVLTGNPNDIYNVSFSPDGKTIALCGSWLGGNNQIQLWDVPTLTEKVTLKLGAYGTRMSFSPDGKTLASGGSDGARLWDVATGKEKVTLINTEGVDSISFSPDGKTLASGSGNGARLWDIATGTEKAILTRQFTRIVSFSPDGKTLATCGWDGTVRLYTVRLWDVKSRIEKATLTGYPISFSPDGITLATCSWDGTVRIWDVETGGEKSTFKADSLRVNSMVFNPDGKTLASASTNGVRLWDVATGTRKIRFTHKGLGDTGIGNIVVFSPDGKTLATGGSFRRVFLWDIATPTENAILSTPKVTLSVPFGTESIIFSLDGKTLATGHWDGTVRLWDVETGIEKTTFIRHTGWVKSVIFSPDGKTLASASNDGTIILWHITVKPPEPERVPADVNGDSTINIQDLVLVAAAFGKTGENDADVNGDGVVNIQDLVLVAAAFEGDASAPLALSHNMKSVVSRAEVQKWLSEVQQLNLTDTMSQRGILFLEQLLASLTPKQNALLPNYPNPFNPETWIPYQLAKPANVSVSIYAADGKLVRSLDLGHQAVGVYQHRNHAAHWDGKNTQGESVASGLYFYTLTADEYTATRRMLILK